MSRFYYLLIIPFLYNAPEAEAKLRPAAGDIVLTSTWRPGSGTHIDCQGGKITAAKPYKLNGDPHRRRIPSTPEFLIYLKDVHDVEIKNCDISGGDMAIYIVRGGRHKITNNKITSLNAIQMYSSSDNLVEGNVIHFGDSGVLVRMNSDRNRVLNNTVQLSETLAKEGGGIAIGAYSTPHAAVFNVIVEGELTQVLNDAHTLEDLEIIDNHIEIARGPGLDDDGEVGVGLAGRTEGGRALNNTIIGGFFAAASFGYEKSLPVIIPGWCSQDATRRCAPSGWRDDPDDCFLPGFDKKSKGQCEGAVFLWGETTEVLDSRFIGNNISDAYIGLAAFLAPTTRIESNDVNGCSRGIEIGDYMLQSKFSKVLGNIVRNSEMAFVISNFAGTSAGAEVSYNDFSGYQTGVYAEQLLCDECDPDPAGYQFETVLSHNHWGEYCEPPGLLPTVSVPESYAAPVAKLYRDGKTGEELGAVCN